MLFCNKVCIACAFRGLVKLKKIGLATPQTPTHPQIYFLQLFWKHVQEKTPPPPKKEIRVGASRTHPLPCFSRIFGFF